MTKKFRNIPSVNSVLESEKIQSLLKMYSTELVTELIRKHLNQIRKDLSKKDSKVNADEIIEFISKTINERWDE